ncbi:hypothetical protein CR513_58460, partial [Mucuna pruriens]
MTIQLANKSVVQPLGVLEDILVQVDELIFSLFGIDLIDELVEEHMQEPDYDEPWEVHDLPNSEYDIIDLAHLGRDSASIDLFDQVCNDGKLECSKHAKVQRIIYPILDNQWVSPIQVVPKKFGMTIMKNQHDELCQCGFKTAGEYATRKDHFPKPFLDQVLEKLVEKSHYYFLDGYSGYMQIHIALEDQHKTTFTCPFSTFSYTRMSFGLYNAPSTL